MRVLMLSTDSQMFTEGSAVRARILEYGKLFEELHVVIYTRQTTDDKRLTATIAGNIFLYPTNGRFKFLYFRDAYRLSRSLVVSRGLSVITSQDPFETGLVAWRLKNKFKLPWQVQIHTDFLSPYFAAASLKNRLRVLLAKWLIKKADRIRVVSDRVKHSLATRYPLLVDRITVLPIFVDIEKFRHGNPDAQFIQKNNPGKAFVILTVARPGPEKNLKLAADIVNELKKRHQNLKWILISSGETLGSLVNYYKIADLFLLTSNYEGYGMAAVEATAAGVPVVMTDVGVALGRTFPVGDKIKGVEIIDKLINDPAERKKVVEEQNRFLENWPTRVQYLEQYKKSLTF